MPETLRVQLEQLSSVELVELIAWAEDRIKLLEDSGEGEAC